MKHGLRFIFLLSFLAITLAGSSVFAQDPGRDEIQEPDRIMDAVGIKPGMIVGEAGAGSGYLTFHLAKRVGDKGHVYANDIDAGALRTINDRATRDSVRTITTVLGTVDDPRFPVKKLDVVISLHAFHDFERPAEWMNNARPYLKPDGLMVIVDLEPVKARYNGTHGYLKEEQVIERMTGTPFELVRIERFLLLDTIYIYRIKH